MRGHWRRTDTWALERPALMLTVNKARNTFALSLLLCRMEGKSHHVGQTCWHTLWPTAPSVPHRIPTTTS